MLLVIRCPILGFPLEKNLVQALNDLVLPLLQVVSALLDFLYTGEMTVDREDTADLQRLIETLQIDPDLITVDIVEQKVSNNENNADKEIESPSKVTDDPKPVTDDLPSKTVSTGDKVVDSILTDAESSTDDKKRKLTDANDDQDGVEVKKCKKD